jgi:hypothetical protein
MVCLLGKFKSAMKTSRTDLRVSKTNVGLTFMRLSRPFLYCTHNTSGVFNCQKERNQISEFVFEK